jgi:hypothetical protein
VYISFANPQFLLNDRDHALSLTRVSILLALAPNLVGRVRLRAFIKPAPAALAISFAAARNVHARTIQNPLEAGAVVILDTRGDKGATAADAFGVNLGVLFAYSRLGQGADDAACCRARNGACGRGR